MASASIVWGKTCVSRTAQSSGICQGRQSIIVPIALKLGKYLGTSAEYWVNLQRRHDLETQRDRFADELEAIEPAKVLECAEAQAGYNRKS